MKSACGLCLCNAWELASPKRAHGWLCCRWPRCDCVAVEDILGVGDETHQISHIRELGGATVLFVKTMGSWSCEHQSEGCESTRTPDPLCQSCACRRSPSANKDRTHDSTVALHRVFLELILQSVLCTSNCISESAVLYGLPKGVSNKWAVMS